MSQGKTPEGVRWMRHIYPLRPDFTVTLELPRDLTTAEAERLGAMLKTLPIPPEQQASGLERP